MGAFPPDMIDTERIVDLKAHSKQEALDELIALLCTSPRAGDPDEVRRKILDRESSHSTGIGMGVAMPHAKTTSSKGFAVAVGRSQAGVDFDAVDGKPVSIIVMMVCNESQSGDFLKVMARFAKCLKDKDFRREVLFARSPEAIRELFATAPA
ncbi:MAG: PTS sugar transporter subunit IIA [Candidatus Sumerlaeia bacterium]|nr:PTS sugar transporter subunit IIA [Candidatus Sumerlaeia bacterium]